eukprot:4213041-Pleurochrysis_carterae.AAC.1
MGCSCSRDAISPRGPSALVCFERRKSSRSVRDMPRGVGPVRGKAGVIFCLASSDIDALASEWVSEPDVPSGSAMAADAADADTDARLRLDSANCPDRAK